MSYDFLEPGDGIGSPRTVSLEIHRSGDGTGHGDTGAHEARKGNGIGWGIEHFHIDCIEFSDGDGIGYDYECENKQPKQLTDNGDGLSYGVYPMDQSEA